MKAGHLLRRTLLALAGLAVLVALAYLPAVAIITAVSYGYGLADMDWNEDGEVTLREVLASEGIGSRPWTEDRACREFFSLKTGLPVRVDCADRSVEGPVRLPGERRSQVATGASARGGDGP